MSAQRFEEGSLVLLTLHSPRQKCVGVLLQLAPAGIVLRCVNLESLGELARQLRSGEGGGASMVFFPMQRVERMEMDEAIGELPSLAETFAAQSGGDLRQFLCGSESAESGLGGASPRGGAAGDATGEPQR